MKKPDAEKMRQMLKRSDSHKLELDKLTSEEVLYEFLKEFEPHEIPKVEVTND